MLYEAARRLMRSKPDKKLYPEHVPTRWESMPLPSGVTPIGGERSLDALFRPSTPEERAARELRLEHHRARRQRHAAKYR